MGWGEDRGWESISAINKFKSYNKSQFTIIGDQWLTFISTLSPSIQSQNNYQFPKTTKFPSKLLYLIASLVRNMAVFVLGSHLSMLATTEIFLWSFLCLCPKHPSRSGNSSSSFPAIVSHTWSLFPTHARKYEISYLELSLGNRSPSSHCCGISDTFLGISSYQGIKKSMSREIHQCLKFSLHLLFSMPQAGKYLVSGE